MSKGSLLGEFEQIVLLAVIRLKNEGYGLSIRREIESRADREVSIGAVYATLERLQSKGFLTSWDGGSSPVRGGRSRRHYGLLPEGAEALQKSRTMMDAMWEEVDLESTRGRA